ncbi:hypothetical protein E3N88_33558 [Mikania micrantha]|uniref:CASP-like protein n=1 Tax=Mikania micrantha TaxID=192012 RepID=A0A5N6MC22_9ASTR|nr:hypothetical protein E3N88_33558 [Mikania micrantha]
MIKLSSSAIFTSIVAASMAALSSANSSSSVQELGRRMGREISLEKDKFTPIFNGLKFINTLVTAHR